MERRYTIERRSVLSQTSQADLLKNWQVKRSIPLGVELTFNRYLCSNRTCYHCSEIKRLEFIVGSLKSASKLVEHVRVSSTNEYKRME